MYDWNRLLAPYVRNVEKHLDHLKYRLNRRLGGPGPIRIVTYIGYGTKEELHLQGRVLEDKHISNPHEDDSIWENLANMYKRMESDEIPHARLSVTCRSEEQEVTADEEGMFHAVIRPRNPIPDRNWHPARVRLLHPIPHSQQPPVEADGRIMVPTSDCRFGIISDIDDTVLKTNAVNLLRMARTVFLANARTRLPFPGAAALYRAFYHGSGEDENPIFFVSSSPWNLYDVLRDFLEFQGFPRKMVLFLRNWGVTREQIFPMEHRDFKEKIIRSILNLYRDIPFILIGDSGQEDPEIYRDITREFPGRILVSYIRNVSTNPDRPEAIRQLAMEAGELGSRLVLAPTSLEMAEHAAEKGWIREESLPDIRVEHDLDLGPTGEPSDEAV